MGVAHMSKSVVPIGLECFLAFRLRACVGLVIWLDGFRSGLKVAPSWCGVPWFCLVDRTVDSSAPVSVGLRKDLGVPRDPKKEDI